MAAVSSASELAEAAANGAVVVDIRGEAEIASNPTVAGAVVLEWKRDAGGWTEEEVAKLAESGDTFIIH
ncbi:hypothetical protein RI054_22g95090 [Pseudoscourfieldia marina]